MQSNQTLNRDERQIVRTKFLCKILKADAQAYEDIFSQIMSYKYKDFEQIKPWGPIGDRKCDGRIKSQGIYFQVFAPEDIRKSYTDAVNKLETDFNELIKYWPEVKQYYFVVNDKYKGFNADCISAIERIRAEYRLEEARILGSSWLENMLFELNDDQIIAIVGGIPNPDNIKQLDYSILNDVIEYIKAKPMHNDNQCGTILPDWNDKIRFNDLSRATEIRLNNASLQIECLNVFLSNNGDFVAEEIKQRLFEAYTKEKMTCSGDELFWKLVMKLSPRDQMDYQSTVIVIMAKYFETCDIFEEPIVEEEK